MPGTHDVLRPCDPQHQSHVWLHAVDLTASDTLIWSAAPAGPLARAHIAFVGHVGGPEVVVGHVLQSFQVELQRPALYPGAGHRKLGAAGELDGPGAGAQPVHPASALHGQLQAHLWG